MDIYPYLSSDMFKLALIATVSLVVFVILLFRLTLCQTKNRLDIDRCLYQLENNRITIKQVSEFCHALHDAISDQDRQIDEVRSSIANTTEALEILALAVSDPEKT